uniref:Uncharacterized protein n=1 Tax=Leersia perrieri TaxID=77586 RepID=A0A0D9WXK9_9ORYZ
MKQIFGRRKNAKSADKDFIGGTSPSMLDQVLETQEILYRIECIYKVYEGVQMNGGNLRPVESILVINVTRYHK